MILRSNNAMASQRLSSSTLFIIFALISSYATSYCSASRASPFNNDGTATTDQLQCTFSFRPYLRFTAQSSSGSPRFLQDEDTVFVTVDGITKPGPGDWVGMFTPSTANLSFCPSVLQSLKELPDAPQSLPAMCTLPVKAQYVSADKGYLGCQHSRCANMTGDTCTLKLCAASLQFHVVNFRSDVVFALFTGGFDNPCLVAKTSPMEFANPFKPANSHLSAIGTNGTSMRVTWVSGDNGSQEVKYGGNETQQTVKSTTTRINSNDMCGEPAKTLGWHDPGYVHTAVMTGLQPAVPYTYTYGSDAAGWSDTINFRTPPNASETVYYLDFIVYGSMGKSSRDEALGHASQPGAALVLNAVKNALPTSNPDKDYKGIDTVIHLGDTSMASGFSLDWDYFLRFIEPIASTVSYMTTIGSVDRDYEGSGSFYGGSASGGECGVPYRNHFQMPTSAPDKPWYSVELGPVHITFISSEHDWRVNSEQYNWILDDLVHVDRGTTPWLLVAGNRPMYSSVEGARNKVDLNYRAHLEPLFTATRVDLVLSGHVHNYERTCEVYDSICIGQDIIDYNKFDTSNYSAPIHVNVGTGGAALENFSKEPAAPWSDARFVEFGYLSLTAGPMDIDGGPRDRAFCFPHLNNDCYLNLIGKFVSAKTGKVLDEFSILKQFWSSE